MLLLAGANPETYTSSGDSARSLAERLLKEAAPARAAVCRDMCELLLAGPGAGAGGSSTSKRPSHASSVSSQASGSAAAAAAATAQQQQQAGGSGGGTQGGSSGPQSTGGGPLGGIRAIFGGRGGLGRSSGMQRMVMDL